MDLLNKIKDKIDSTKEYFANKFYDSTIDSEQHYESLGKNKEINFNQIESKKVQYIKKASSYDLKLLINGKSIFENLIITAIATKKDEQIPIKCHWKRIHDESAITIQNISSFSYIPNAEDIGYKIEVEVYPIDDMNDIAIAQYGPIVIDKDMENAIELFLTSGKNFNLYLFDEKTQEKIKDKEYILYLKNDEIILSTYDINGKEHILEKCFYSQMNPIIKLSPTNINKIKFTFINYDSENNNDIENENFFNKKNNEIVCGKKTDYEFITMSKQNRELIYLLIQFFIIDEKIKNKKIYSLINNESIQTDEKLGITDLVGELNIIKQQNKIDLRKIDKLNDMNKKLNDDYKILEDNFMLTLSQINEKNSNSRIKEEIYKANDRSENSNSISKQNKASINKINQLKKEYEDLNTQYQLLQSKEQELDFDKNILISKESTSQTKLLNTQNTLQTLKDKNNTYKIEINISKEKLNKAKEEYNNLKVKYDTKKKLLNSLNNENENILQKSAEYIQINKGKNEMTKIKKSNEALIIQNKNLLNERDILNQAQVELSNELEKLKQEIKELNEDNANNIISTENNDIITELKRINEERKNEIKKLKEEYNNLSNEQKNLQESCDKLQNKNLLNQSIVSMSVASVNGYQLSPDEYEEYDLLRKNKDENEAIILQLKSNNQAKEVEKQELKEILKNLGKKK